MSAIPSQTALSAEDKAKLDHEHHNKMVEIFLDKVLLTVVLGILGLLASLQLESFKTDQATILADHQIALNKTLEEHRTNLANQQFFVQKRYEALNEVVQAYGELFDVYQAFLRKEAIELADRKTYRTEIDKIVKLVNKLDLILPLEYSQEIERVLFLHRGLLFKDFKSYRPFIRFVSERVTSQAQRQLTFFERQPDKRFVLAPFPPERNDQTAHEYLQSHFQQWKQLD